MPALFHFALEAYGWLNSSSSVSSRSERRSRITAEVAKYMSRQPFPWLHITAVCSRVTSAARKMLDGVSELYDWMSTGIKSTSGQKYMANSTP